MPLPQLEAPLAEPILIDGLSWREFKTAEQLLDRPGIRLSFLDGTLEIQKMPGKTHETFKKRIAALVEIYLEYAEIDFVPTGSMTLENEAGQVKWKADESYELGQNRSRPDLAIEVVITSGGIDKLTAYKRLQIPEVWFWEKGALAIYQLCQTGYQPIQRSAILPGLEISLLVQCINLPNHTQSLKIFRQSLPPSESI
jgi:Uma2 family endonuclease